jgi:GT2 family glycosyltransferase
MDRPIFHLMIPTYGESPYLHRTLESAVEVLSPNTPITVIQDLSPNQDTERLVKSFGQRIQFLKNDSRLGIAGNFNKCIEKSLGVFTQICGSDDIIITDPTNYIAKLDSNYQNLSFVSFGVEVIDTYEKRIWTATDVMKSFLRPEIDKYQNIKKRKLLRSLILGDWMYFPAILWNTEIIKELKFSKMYHTAMDLDMAYRLISKGYDSKFYNNKIIKYRRHSKSASSLHALDGARFIEEFNCQREARGMLIKNGWLYEKILIQLSIAIRLKAFITGVIQIQNNPKEAKKLFKLVFFWI